MQHSAPGLWHYIAHVRQTGWLSRVFDAMVRRASGQIAAEVMAHHGGHAPQDSRLSYAALGILESRYGWRQTSLTAAEMRVFSQNGEDGVLAEIFARIGTTNRYFIEFGIESGIEGNAVLLADVLGWSGLFIEADDQHFARLAAKYAHSAVVATRHAMVLPDNVDDLFRQSDVPDGPDLLSIDVDGADYFIWEALTAVRPRVVVIEYNSARPLDRREVASPELLGPDGWDGTDYFGCSLSALQDLARRKGYRLAHLELTGLNAFFVRTEDWDALQVEEVLLRAPNYYLSGTGHAADPFGRPYLELGDS